MDPRFTQPVSREQIVAIIRQRAERNLDQVHTSHRGELVEEVGAPAHSTSLHWLAGAPGQIRMSTVELAGGLVERDILLYPLLCPVPVSSSNATN